MTRANLSRRSTQEAISGSRLQGVAHLHLILSPLLLPGLKKEAEGTCGEMLKPLLPSTLPIQGPGETESGASTG